MPLSRADAADGVLYYMQLELFSSIVPFFYTPIYFSSIVAYFLQAYILEEFLDARRKTCTIYKKTPASCIFFGGYIAFVRIYGVRSFGVWAKT